MANYTTTDTELTSIANTIRTKGGTSAPLTYPQGFVTAISNIETGIDTSDATATAGDIVSGRTAYVDGTKLTGTLAGAIPDNDVNFYDYDGALVYSYSADEFLALAAFPPNPCHSRLVAQGWNWNFEAAQNYVRVHHMLDVGQTYTTASGASEFDVEISTSHLSICATIAVRAGSSPWRTHIEIDWGDGSEHDEQTRSIADTLLIWHHYANPGLYTISIFADEVSGYNNPGIEFAGCIFKTYYMSNSAGQYTASADNIIKNAHFSQTARINGLWNNKTSDYNYGLSPFRLETMTLPLPSSYQGNNYGQTGHFSTISSLKTIIIPNGITMFVSDMSIWYSIEHFISPNSLNTIDGPSSDSQPNFGDAVAMTRLSLPDGLSVDTIYIPESIKRVSYPSIGTKTVSMLSGNRSSHTLVESMILPSSKTDIGNSQFASWRFLRNVTLPSALNTIGLRAFNSCNHLEGLVIPNTVSSIGNFCFTMCYRLKNINIPSSITNLPQSIFSNSGIEKLVIPASVTTIGSSAIYQCYFLSEIHFLGSTPPILSSATSIAELPACCTIYVPEGSLGDYALAQYYPSVDLYSYVEE